VGLLGRICCKNVLNVPDEKPIIDASLAPEIFIIPSPLERAVTKVFLTVPQKPTILIGPSLAPKIL